MRRGRKGQVALEYLVLSLVALALLALSITALMNIRSYAAHSTNVFQFRSSAEELANAMAETCALGDGNGRTIHLSAPLAIEGQEGMVRFSGAGITLVRKSACGVQEGQQPEGDVYVENEKGVIKITAP